MLIKGLDFTSSPSLKKPITCATCTLVGNLLTVNQVEWIADFKAFEELLAEHGTWMLGCDFPFAQSRRLVENLNWPDCWAGYVDLVAKLSRDEFVALLEDYKRERASGDKEHRREADKLAKSISPQKLYGTPVGKMFYEGAKRLLASPADIVPFRASGAARIIAEVYPALVARFLVGKRSYKNDTRGKQTPALTAARKAIVAGLREGAIERQYGIRMTFSDKQANRWVSNHSGDELDAVLGAIQAAWAWKRKGNSFGVPDSVDPVEGWICDPAMVPT
jgi:hypothetical protein